MLQRALVVLLGAITVAQAHAACWGIARIELNGFVPDLFVRSAAALTPGKFTWRYGYQVVDATPSGDFCGIWARSTVPSISLINTYDRNQLSAPFEWAAVGPADGGLSSWTLGVVASSASPSSGTIDLAKNDGGDVHRVYVPIGSVNVYVSNQPFKTWFTVTASAQNRNGSAVELRHPLLDNKPEAVVFVNLVHYQIGPALPTINHPVALRFDTQSRRWLIQFDDQASIPEGTRFHVRIDPAGSRVVAESGQNIRASMLAIRHPSADRNPKAVVIATPVNNDVRRPSPIAVRYVKPNWFVVNTDGTPMPNGAKFNIRVFGSAILAGELGIAPNERSHVYGVTTDASSRSRTLSGRRMLDHPQLNSKASSVVITTQNWNADNGAGKANIGHVALEYIRKSRSWALVNTNGSPMRAEASFNIWTNSGSWATEPPPLVVQ